MAEKRERIPQIEDILRVEKTRASRPLSGQNLGYAALHSYIQGELGSVFTTNPRAKSPSEHAFAETFANSGNSKNNGKVTPEDMTELWELLLTVNRLDLFQKPVGELEAFAEKLAVERIGRLDANIKGSDTQLGQLIPDKTVSAETSALDNVSMEEIIRVMQRILTPRELKLVLDRHLRDLTFVEIAKERGGIKRQGLWATHKKAMEKLRMHGDVLSPFFSNK